MAASSPPFVVRVLSVHLPRRWRRKPGARLLEHLPDVERPRVVDGLEDQERGAEGGDLAGALWSGSQRIGGSSAGEMPRRRRGRRSRRPASPRTSVMPRENCRKRSVMPRMVGASKPPAGSRSWWRRRAAARGSPHSSRRRCRGWPPFPPLFVKKSLKPSPRRRWRTRPLAGFAIVTPWPVARRCRRSGASGRAGSVTVCQEARHVLALLGREQAGQARGPRRAAGVWSHITPRQAAVDEVAEAVVVGVGAAAVGARAAGAAEPTRRSRPPKGSPRVPSQCSGRRVAQAADRHGRARLVLAGDAARAKEALAADPPQQLVGVAVGVAAARRRRCRCVEAKALLKAMRPRRTCRGRRVDADGDLVAVTTGVAGFADVHHRARCCSRVFST